MKAKETKVLSLEPGPVLKHDGKLWVSTGKSRYEKTWANKQLLWSRILKKLSEPTRTPETYKEYMKMARRDQDNVKDVGGFVGGTLKDGKRSAHKLIALGVAEAVQAAERSAGDKDTAAVKKTASAGKSAAKTVGKK